MPSDNVRVTLFSVNAELLVAEMGGEKLDDAKVVPGLDDEVAEDDDAGDVGGGTSGSDCQQVKLLTLCKSVR